MSDLCDNCCEWVSSHHDVAPEAVMADYPDMMRRVLSEFGLTDKAADEFIENACAGNWKRMHESNEEKETLDARYYADELLCDVWYCSDRWSWDRIIRIQWLYQRILDRCGRYSTWP